MESEMRGIGEMARDRGLSVSALRFYDRSGVLVPAWVDPVWLPLVRPGRSDEARLPARPRRAGMPPADIGLVPAGWSNADTDLVRGLLQAHLRRLERGLAGACIHTSTCAPRGRLRSWPERGPAWG